MRTTIYLVRHAEAEVNLNPLTPSESDVLTENGLKQAQLVATRLKDFPIETIYTSKISRALRTAEVIGSAFNKAPIIIESLKERKVIYTNQKDYTHQETFDDLKIRLIETKTFLENLPTGHVVVVSHALFLRALVAYIAVGELLTEELLQKITETLLVSHAAISIISYNQQDHRWHIESLNDQAHLLKSP